MATKYEYFEDLSRQDIRFRDLKGRGFEDSGDRPNIGIWINDLEKAKRLEDEGWPIKYTEPENEDEEQRAYLKMKVYWPKNPDYAGPKIVLVTDDIKTIMTPETIGNLDAVDVLKIDIKAHWFPFEKGKRTFHCAAVDSLYMTVKEDRLERKYRSMEVPEYDDEEAIPFD